MGLNQQIILQMCALCCQWLHRLLDFGILLLSKVTVYIFTAFNSNSTVLPMFNTADFWQCVQFWLVVILEVEYTSWYIMPNEDHGESLMLMYTGPAIWCRENGGSDFTAKRCRRTIARSSSEFSKNKCAQRWTRSTGLCIGNTIGMLVCCPPSMSGLQLCEEY